MDAFDTLGLDPTLDLDVSTLEQRYRDLQRQLHPDKFVQASSSEKRESLSRAVSVNDAYRALKDPLKRAEIVLARHGAKVPEREPVDPEFLMEVMELRESLAEAKKERNLSKAHRLAVSVRALEEAATGSLRKALNELQQGREHGREHAQSALGRLRYFKRFHDEVARFEEDLLE
jgi:molecular chaperone HscB